MFTTTDENGLLNNYAVEPPVYFAQYPTLDEQQRYVAQGAVAALLVALAVLTAVSVSVIG